MRQPSPFSRQFIQSWYVTIRGRQYALGRDKAVAWQRYHAIMAARAATEQTGLVAQLCDLYFDWCRLHRKEATFDKPRRYLQCWRYIARLTMRGSEEASAQPWSNFRILRCLLLTKAS